MNAQPRFIGSASPFKQWAEKYFESGFNPIPLPPGKKNPPPTGWTGHGRPMVDWPQLGRWIDGGDPNIKYPISKANIGLRLNTIEVDGKQWDLVGIDVDHHPEDKDDPKDGGPQLEYFEKKLGKLPDTWTSSARTNGIAGIRLFRAPTGLMWRGDLGPGGEDVDIISKNYRFAVVFPSTNPDADDAQYWWYPPGFAPDGNHDHQKGLIPNPKTLPVLPDKWVDYCTQGRIKDIGVPMDMDASADQLITWARAKFALNDEVCPYLRVELDKWKLKLEESAKSHNVLTAFHNHILRCGANEGHTGWGKACVEFEKLYVSEVLKRNKRTVTSAKAEIKRSKIGCLRRIKGEADEMRKKHGANYFDMEHRCTARFSEGIEIDPPKAGGWPEAKPDKDAGDYTLNDDGNGEHWLDIHEGNVHFVSNVIQKWIIWDGKRWVVDEKDDVARYLYRRVKRRQMLYAAQLYTDWAAEPAGPKKNKLKKLFEQWRKHALNSGNVRDIDRALQAARAVRQGISIKFEDLDKDRRALGTPPGVLRFKHKEQVKSSRWQDVIELVDNTKEMLITRNTGVEYIPLKDQRNHPDPAIRKGYKLFRDFMQKFTKDCMEDQVYFQKLCGSTIIGDDAKKMAIFFWGKTDTGKSTLTNLMVESLGLGQYAATRGPEFLRAPRLNPQLAEALPMRLIAVSELGDNEVNNENFKRITGGEPITVELKNKNNLVQANAQFTMVINTNDVPKVPGEDEAFRGRLRVVEFKHQADEVEKTKGKATQQELYKFGKQACFAWLVEGAAKYVVDGLHPIPVEILMATEQFTSKLSDIAEFVDDNLMVVKGETVTAHEVYDAFKRWASTNNFDQKSWTPNRLTRRMKAMGFEQTKKRLTGPNGQKTQPITVWKNLILMSKIQSEISENR